jgi:hypothetical protein
VRERDGVRRQLRCAGCRQRERPNDDTTWFLCDDCLEAVREALSNTLPVADMLLFRSYSVEARCPHANEDTILAVYPCYFDGEFGFEHGRCVRCVEEEQARRSAG